MKIIEKINELLEVSWESEEDLKVKLVLPFFKLLGYNDKMYQLGYPIKTYNPHKSGRKPEADLVFFENEVHNEKTSLLVVETKRIEDEDAEKQARFYSNDLFVPFYVVWGDYDFTVYQAMRFSDVAKIESYSLKSLTETQFKELSATLSPTAIRNFCMKYEIKEFKVDLNKLLEYISIYKQNQIEFLNKIDFLKIKEINLEEIYVTLQLKEYQMKYFDEIDRYLTKHPTFYDKGETFVLLKSIIQNFHQILLIGHPGSGKTTELRKFCFDHCKKEDFNLPVYIPIKLMIAKEDNLIEYIKNELKIIPDSSKIDFLLDYLIRNGKLILCLDGLDELDIKEPEAARKILRKINENIREIVQFNKNNIVIASIRKESFLRITQELELFSKVYEIMPLSKNNIEKFIKIWYKEEISVGNQLLQKLIELNWPDITKNPLLLTLISVHFDKSLKIPYRISTLYRHCVDLLLEKWDATRRISRFPRININPDNVIDILMEIALFFHLQGQACFDRREILKVIKSNVESIGIDPKNSRDVFEEITLQYGLLCSWSIETLYAFPHLSFQEYFTALALRERNDGTEIVLTNLENPFWKNVLFFYVEMGDSTQIISKILEGADNIVHSYLFLAAECLSHDPKIKNPECRNTIIDSLEKLTKSKERYFREKSIDYLAKIPPKIITNILLRLMMDEKGEIRASKYAFKYAHLVLPNNQVIVIIERDFMNLEHFMGFSLENYRVLPQEEAINHLTKLINEGSFNLNKFDEFHWRIIFAAEILVFIGQGKSISTIISILKNPLLKHYDYMFCRIGFRQLYAPENYDIFEKLLDDVEISDKAKVYLTDLCSPSNLKAKNFLLSLVGDKSTNHFTRRDAANILSKFNLNEGDLNILEELLIDSDPTHFWGGSAGAAKAISTIKSEKALKVLKNALNEWKKRESQEKWRNSSRPIQIEIKLLLLISDASKNNFDLYTFFSEEVLRGRLIIWYDVSMFVEKNKVHKFSTKELDFIIKTLSIESFSLLPRPLLKQISNIITDEAYSYEIKEKLLDKFITLFRESSGKGSNILVFLEEIWNQLKPKNPLTKKFS